MRVPALRGRGSAEETAALATWVQAAREGDGAAFGRIWQLLSPKVHGYLRVRGVTSPEDVTSDVFVAAFAGIGSFTGDGAAFRSWLFTIAHHKAVDDLRRRAPTTEWTPEVDPRSAASAEDDAVAGTVGTRVRRMLDGLTPEQREVLILRTVGDLSVAEVAAITGRTEGSVKQLYRRAMQSARRAADAPAVVPAAHLAESDRHHSGGSFTSPVTRAASTAMTEL
jgi:RNA polymerase sigma-70 factor (ECF subfamily)